MAEKKQKKPAARKPAAGKKKTIKKRKNISQKIPNGRTLQTRDEFFENEGKYRKPGYEKKGLYRKVVVVDSNRKDELAVVKLTTSEKGDALPNYKKGKSKYRPFLMTKDNKGKAIKVGGKFVENSPSDDVSKNDVNKIKKNLFKQSSRRLAKENKRKARELKGRK